MAYIWKWGVSMVQQKVLKFIIIMLLLVIIPRNARHHLVDAALIRKCHLNKVLFDFLQNIVKYHFLRVPAIHFNV